MYMHMHIICGFGVQILGFEQIESPKFGFNVIWLKLAPSFFLHLIERDPETKLPEGPWSASSAVEDPKSLPRGHHICFSVSNFDSFVQTLKVFSFSFYVSMIVYLSMHVFFLQLVFRFTCYCDFG